MIFDTHAHYDDEAFDQDRDELLNSMNENGIINIVNVGADIRSSGNSIALAERYDYIYAAVGVHPSDTAGITEDDLEQIQVWTKEEKVVAIGEIGLDYYYKEPEKEIQRKWFVKQLELAKSCGLPVIIHSREAANETFEILKSYGDKISGGVIHCYSYSPELAKEYVKMGYYIGIGGVVTFKNAKKLKETVEACPLDSIVLETDCPYLSPEPNRGKRNSSLNLPYVVSEIARLKKVSDAEVIERTYRNALDLYHIHPAKNNKN
ncbi:MAG: TatD family hydrolase [Lachnospiraceae bacterium]|nr:TatD family hydrolase [Lachnospiraceae bacterium]